MNCILKGSGKVIDTVKMREDRDHWRKKEAAAWKRAPRDSLTKEFLEECLETLGDSHPRAAMVWVPVGEGEKAEEALLLPSEGRVEVTIVERNFSKDSKYGMTMFW